MSDKYKQYFQDSPLTTDKFLMLYFAQMSPEERGDLSDEDEFLQDEALEMILVESGYPNLGAPEARYAILSEKRELNKGEFRTRSGKLAAKIRKTARDTVTQSVGATKKRRKLSKVSRKKRKKPRRNKTDRKKTDRKKTHRKKTHRKKSKKKLQRKHY